MKWKRIVGYGVVLWLVPFVIATLLFTVRENNRALFESLITVIGVASAVGGSLLFFRKVPKVDLGAGLIVGIGWAAISIVIDLPFFLGVFRMALADYAADIALTYLAFPLIATGIAVAMSSAQANAA